jgi:acetyltransferase-like isoleucine patch superfamily enzyme
MNLIAKFLYGFPNRIERRRLKFIFCGLTGNKPNGLIIRGKIYLENKNILIGKNVDIYPGVTFAGNGLIRIGDNCKIGQNTIIYANNNGGVVIGDNTIIAAQNYIIDSNHNMNAGRKISDQGLSSSLVTIGEDVWLGANVTVIKGAVIQNGVVVGAKSLVNSEIAENSIAVGVPARIIGTRKNCD